MTFLTNLSDLVLVWLHGRRLGLTGDGQSSGTSLLVLDGVAVGSSRSGVAAIPSVITTNAGTSGSVVLAGAAVGDSVQRVISVTATDLSADFEATITISGHIQQVATTGGAVQAVAYIQPQS